MGAGQYARPHPLILNPGLTFGTGSHATTRLCLTALEETIHGGERVLDLGCGSGILSIAALRLGRSTPSPATSTKCVEVAYENAALNGIDRSRYTVRWGDVLSDQQLKAEIGGGYDMVVANIVADVIIGLSGQVRPFLKEGGLFLCSGIIDDRAEEVAQRLREADGAFSAPARARAGSPTCAGNAGFQRNGRTPYAFHKKRAAPVGAALCCFLRQYVWPSGLCLADADDLIPALVVAGGLEGAGEEAPVSGIDIAPRLHHIAGIGGLDLLLLPGASSSVSS